LTDPEGSIKHRKVELVNWKITNNYTAY
jgi:hypothetical protein